MEELPSSSSSELLTKKESEVYSNWEKMLEICEDREDCFFGNHQTLFELNQRCEGSGLAVIGNFLELINVTSNYKIKLSDLQIVMLSTLIYNKFSYLKDTEIMLFFHDYFLIFSEERFFGSIEMKTIINMLKEWVREKRGRAILEHDRQIKRRKEEENKQLRMSWNEYCQVNGIESSDSPIQKILNNLDKPIVPKDTKESISNSAKALIENKLDFGDEAMVKARRAFILRYGYTPEDHIRTFQKEIIDETTDETNA